MDNEISGKIFPQENCPCQICSAEDEKCKEIIKKELKDWEKGLRINGQKNKKSTFKRKIRGKRNKTAIENG